MDFEIIDANTLFGFDPSHRLDLSVERLLRDMERYKVTSSVTLSTMGIFNDYQKGNEATMAVAADKRLIPAGTINPQTYFSSADEIARIAQNFRLFRFFPEEQGWPIDSVAFELVLKHIAPFKPAVMVDATYPGEPSRLMKIVRDYPGTVVLSSISDNTLAEALALMLELPNVVVETHELHVPGALKLLSERVGAHRIIFGSGAPRRSTASSLNYILNSELSHAEKSLVLGGNMKQILEGN